MVIWAKSFVDSVFIDPQKYKLPVKKLPHMGEFCLTVWFKNLNITGPCWDVLMHSSVCHSKL
jgi:hypothetical protein